MDAHSLLPLMSTASSAVITVHPQSLGRPLAGGGWVGGCRPHPLTHPPAGRYGRWVGETFSVTVNFAYSFSIYTKIMQNLNINE